MSAGQSLWLDTISRDMIAGGELRRLVSEVGIRGVTTNPDIFQKALATSRLYDEAIGKLAGLGNSTLEIYEALVVEDVRKAADILRPVWEKSGGEDGYVSLEVSPHLAHDAVATMEEADRLWRAVNRPNLMIKVPATAAGVVAVEELIAQGINVNVTLLFSLRTYREVMEAYAAGLRRRAKRDLDLRSVRSVASFFVSRIDTAVDKMLAARVTNLPQPQGEEAARLFGKAAVASAKLAFAEFERFFSGTGFAKLRAAGANVQRPLWASTSTKNPLYPPLAYVTPLIGRGTVNTVPRATLDVWLREGVVQPDAIRDDLDGAKQVIAQLEALGIHTETVAQQLLEEGVGRFINSFDVLLATVARKRLEALGFPETQTEEAGSSSAGLKELLDAVTEARFIPRLWKKDTTLWTTDAKVAEKIANRLGWLDAPFAMFAHCRVVQRFADDVRKSGIRHVVLLGMGGSSLCPEVCAKTFGARRGYPELIVLDNTSPDAVRAVEKRIDLTKTLFIPASKSGTTIETSSFYKYFNSRLISAGVQNVGDYFAAITDPGTSLAELARREDFRGLFENPPDIGGRFSALSLFGLVPMALLGLDIAQVLTRAAAYALDRSEVVRAESNSAVRLGVFMAQCARNGRDKLTLVLSEKIASFGDWAEQLVAESTGKRGVGILPVVHERLAPVSVYAADRAFVSMRLASEKEDARVDALAKKGFPVARIVLRDALDLSVEFIRWELATAIAGALLGINPFDEPNVTESKQNTSRLLGEFVERHELPAPPVHVSTRGLELTFSQSATKVVGSKISRPRDALRALLLSAEPPDYIAFLVYGAMQKRVDLKIAALRAALQKATTCATTFGYAPRYLHSTGQLHKGGPNTGIFITIVPEPHADVPIPGEPYSFATLSRAQALGDFEALDQHGRRAVLVRCGRDVAAALDELRVLAGLEA